MEELPQLPVPANTHLDGVSPVRARHGARAAAPYEMDAGETTGGLIEYWRILRRRKGTVILIGFIGLALGFLISLPQTPVYQARASLEVQDMNQDFLNMRQVTPESQSYTALTDIQTQIKILQSETLRARTMAKLKITDARDLKPQASRLAVWRRAFNLPEPEGLDARESLRNSADRSLKVRAAGQTRIIELLVDSTDPALAASFANTLANEYIDQNMEARWKMSQRTGDWLGRQIDDMRIKLERSEDALQAYARRAGLLFTGGSGGDKDGKQNISEAKLSQIQQSLSSASADRVSKQSRYEMATTSPAETLPDVLNDSILRDYQSKLTDIRRQIAELSATYTPEYSKVKRFQAEAQTIEAALGIERAAILKRIKNDYDEAVRREKLLADDYARQSQVVTQEAERSIQYNILKREVDSNRQLYEAMLQHVKESGIAAALKASNVRVVDAAAPPKTPYKPNVPMNAGLGLLAGAFLGIAFVVMLERADRTFQAPGDAPFWMDLPELGVIPNEKAASRRLYYYGRPQALPEATEAATPAITTAGEKLPPRLELITLQRKPSMVAEAFRTVLTSVLFSGENGSRPRVLVVTSSGPSEGKTTVCCNLAIAMAEIGRRVLLVDADLRKPRVHAVFGLDNDRGLVDVLKSRSVDEGMLADLVRETCLPGLFALTSGAPTSAAANLLFATHMPELLSRFKKDFDLVLIDTPPMLQMPDARVLGRMADAVVLVNRAGHTTRDAALAAQQRLVEDESRILGTILNDWNPKTSPNGYYGYYKGHYYDRYRSHYGDVKN